MLPTFKDLFNVSNNILGIFFFVQMTAEWTRKICLTFRTTRSLRLAIKLKILLFVSTYFLFR
jgi:hypothetical protein